MATLKLEIVTPEAKIYSEDVDMVTLPGSEGELGVYPKHVPLLTTLKPGELRVMKDGRETAMAVGEGFVEIKADAVSVLTDMALGIREDRRRRGRSRCRARESGDERRSWERRSRRHSGVAAKSARAIARQTPSPWVAHASRVLVSASRRNRLSGSLSRCKRRKFSESSRATAFIRENLLTRRGKLA